MLRGEAEIVPAFGDCDVMDKALSILWLQAAVFFACRSDCVSLETLVPYGRRIRSGAGKGGEGVHGQDAKERKRKAIGVRYLREIAQAEECCERGHGESRGNQGSKAGVLYTKLPLVV